MITRPPAAKLETTRQMDLAVFTFLLGTAVFRILKYPPMQSTVPLCNSKLFISRSCPILVLTTVMGRPRRADVEKDVKNYQGPKKALLSRF